MKKALITLPALALLALAGCSNTPSDEALAEAGKQACIAALDEANSKTGNMPTIAHQPDAEFVISKAEGHERRGSMTWHATIYTKAGIPWEHLAQCIADVSATPPKVTYLKAEIDQK